MREHLGGFSRLHRENDPIAGPALSPPGFKTASMASSSMEASDPALGAWSFQRPVLRTAIGSVLAAEGASGVRREDGGLTLGGNARQREPVSILKASRTMVPKDSRC